MASIDDEISATQQELERQRQRLSELRRQRPPEPIDDYQLLGRGNVPVRLSELFGGRRDLLVVHNMGRACTYCTLWADGFAGLLDHLEDRAAVALVSPDPPEVQESFARRRGWRLRMVSAEGSSFVRDMGFEKGNQVLPGVSAFYLRSDGSIVRTNKDVFGPFDPYNAPWHLFDLLKDGAAGWQPKQSYT